MGRTLNSVPERRPTNPRWLRPLIGLTALGAGIVGLIALYFVTVPERNIQPVLLGLGVVLGWGSSVVQSEYGGSSASRKILDSLTDGDQEQVSGDHQ